MGNRKIPSRQCGIFSCLASSPAGSVFLRPSGWLRLPLPEISRFLGMVILMYYNDHPPPHFHVRYGSYRAVVDIGSLAVIAGRLPPRALGLVTE